ncbi:MAG: flagellar export protein FliJ [Candidatus Eremiobacteraeota bacterium]|nr:flagellar export protein FliJ [Candidatus Eremiobacteraeota bacterium]
MPKKFAFALQPVLEHRKRIEDEKKQTLALRQRAVDEAKRELERLNDEFRHHTSELRRRHRELRLEELRLHYAHLQFLDRTIEVQIRVVAERQAAAERARLELVEASKNRKVVDKLKDRRRAAFVAEELRVEQLELDDGNARRYGRVQRQSGGAS